jgi:hypothetical protein
MNTCRRKFDVAGAHFGVEALNLLFENLYLDIPQVSTFALAQHVLKSSLVANLNTACRVAYNG